MVKITLISVLIAILLVGFVSAGFVSFLSNSVSATTNVEGPIFYTASSSNLIMNDEPSSSSTRKIYGMNATNFISERNFNGLNFYKPKLKFVVDLEINNFSTSRGIELEFGYVSENGNSVRLCNVQHIGITENGNFSTECDGSVVPTNIKHFYYMIKGMGDGNIKYKVKTKYSYVKIIDAIN